MLRKEWLPNHHHDNLSCQGAEDKILLSASGHVIVGKKHRAHKTVQGGSFHILTCSVPPVPPSWMTCLADLRIYLAAGAVHLVTPNGW